MLAIKSVTFRRATTALRARIPVIARRSFITVVGQAEVAYREFLGSTRTRLEPGLRLKFPIVHRFTRVDLREQSCSVSVDSYTKDNVPVHVSADVFYTVVNAEKACFSIQDVHASTALVAASTVRALVGRMEYDTIIRERTELSRALMEEIGSSIEDWGIASRRVEVSQFRPANRNVEDQLQKQLEAERERRKNELDTLARIRTAEGEKRSTELNAEGAATALRIESDAKRYSTEQAANADKFAVIARGEAQATELAIIAKTFDGNVDAAATFLVKQRQLEHLASIARSGKKTNTYVLPDSSSLLPIAAMNAAQLK